MSIDKCLTKTLENHKKINGNCIQFFTKNPVKFENIKLNANGIKNLLLESNIKIYIHSQFIINLCEISDWAKKSIIDDIKFGELIGASGIIIHIGKNCKKYNRTKEQGYNIIKSFIKEILNEYKSCKILLENSAGQGTELGGDPEDLLYFKDLNVNFCINTAHLWGKGYEIKEYFTNFNNIIGYDRLDLIHLNDSLVNKGDRKDRHAPLLVGKMNIDKDIKFLLDLNTPIILETGGNYKEEIEYLKNQI